jgi:hypothetical protein
VSEDDPAGTSTLRIWPTDAAASIASPAVGRHRNLTVAADPEQVLQDA